MASLNTLRTRFGVVLSIIIAFALLAFILSLKTDMGLSGNDQGRCDRRFEDQVFGIY